MERGERDKTDRGAGEDCNTNQAGDTAHLSEKKSCTADLLERRSLAALHWGGFSPASRWAPALLSMRLLSAAALLIRRTGETRR